MLEGAKQERVQLPLRSPTLLQARVSSPLLPQLQQASAAPSATERRVEEVAATRWPRLGAATSTARPR